MMVAPGISNLFQELIDNIIDHLQNNEWAEHDADSLESRALISLKSEALIFSRVFRSRSQKNDSLKSSALISRVFRSRSQKHLFTHIGVYMTGSNVAQSMLERLNDVFSMNPQLASHVRIFTLRLPEAGDLWNQSFSHPHFIACLTHMLQSSDPYPSPGGPHIHLTTDTAYGDRLEAIALPRSQISIDSRTHFIPSVVTSRLTSIRIRDLHDVPIALFDNCSNLSTLNIFGIKLAPFEESERVPIEKRPLIRELLVADSEDLICRTGLRFDALERLVFQGSLNDSDMATMQHIFNSDLSSLEYLNFFHLPACSEIDAYLYPKIGADFSRMPNLRELKLLAICSEPTWNQWPYHIAATNIITGLAEFLATFPTDHKLKRIDIFFDCFMDLKDLDMSCWPVDIRRHLSSGNWADFDLMIVRIASAAEHLLELCIMMKYFIERDDEDSHDEILLEDWGVTYLPCTSESPKVVMEVITLYEEEIAEYRYSDFYNRLHLIE